MSGMSITRLHSGAASPPVIRDAVWFWTFHSFQSRSQVEIGSQVEKQHLSQVQHIVGDHRLE